MSDPEDRHFLGVIVNGVDDPIVAHPTAPLVNASQGFGPRRPWVLRQSEDDLIHPLKQNWSSTEAPQVTLRFGL